MRPTSEVERNPVRPPTGCAEDWRGVLGLEDRYQVSSLGRVRNAAGRMLQLQPAGNPKAGRPYLRAELWCAGERIPAFVHCLVALAFLGEPPPGTHVHHVNRDGRDNRAANLTYMPAAAHLQGHRRGAANPCAALCDGDVRAIRRALAEGCTETQLARRYAVSRGAISNIRLGRTWAHVQPLEATQ